MRVAQEGQSEIRHPVAGKRGTEGYREAAAATIRQICEHRRTWG